MTGFHIETPPEMSTQDRLLINRKISAAIGHAQRVWPVGTDREPIGRAIVGELRWLIESPSWLFLLQQPRYMPLVEAVMKEPVYAQEEEAA